MAEGRVVLWRGECGQRAELTENGHRAIVCRRVWGLVMWRGEARRHKALHKINVETDQQLDLLMVSGSCCASDRGLGG